jgi:hypothetical protein
VSALLTLFSFQKEIAMATLILADENQPEREVMPQNGTDFEGPQLHTLLSCDMIEVRRLPDGRIMIFDEEGKLKDKPRNPRATALAHFATPQQLIATLLKMRKAGIDVTWMGDPITDLTTETDYIAGDALICNPGELQ